MSRLQSLVEAERAFAAAAAAHGLRDAFISFLADESVLFRPGAVPGREWMRAEPPRPGLLAWHPMFAEVAHSGDLGYTTGPWEFWPEGRPKSPTGQGYFVSIWRTQPDGTWRVLLDTGIDCPPPANFGAWEPPANGHSRPSPAGWPPDVEVERTALISTDRAFADDARLQGLAGAFDFFALDEVRVYRAGYQPFVGKDVGRAFLAAQGEQPAWDPLAAGVSRSGDLGYTYGEMQWPPERRAMYVHLWKKAADQRWKLALAITSELPAAE
jgi:ketosteroid isomerase-like protein